MVLLKTQNITKRFEGFTAVDKVSMKIRDNEIRSIIGPNGAGKTTLFNLITGVLPVTEGTILFQNQDITNKPVYARPYLGISRSYQIVNLYPEMNVFENIQAAVSAKTLNYYTFYKNLSNYNGVVDKSNRILSRVGLIDKKNMEVNSLSYGDQRHLEIGMAIASNPKLLLLDEPTAGMGEAETLETAELITELAKEVAIILVEHDIETVMSISDFITVLNKGSIVAEGNPEEIKTNKTVKEVYLTGGSYA